MLGVCSIRMANLNWHISCTRALATVTEPHGHIVIVTVTIIAILLLKILLDSMDSGFCLSIHSIFSVNGEFTIYGLSTLLVKNCVINCVYNTE